MKSALGRFYQKLGNSLSHLIAFEVTKSGSHDHLFLFVAFCGGSAMRLCRFDPRVNLVQRRSHPVSSSRTSDIEETLQSASFSSVLFNGKALIRAVEEGGVRDIHKTPAKRFATAFKPGCLPIKTSTVLPVRAPSSSGVSPITLPNVFPSASALTSSTTSSRSQFLLSNATKNVQNPDCCAPAPADAARCLSTPASTCGLDGKMR